MNDFISSFREAVDYSISTLRDELKGIRTGRAHTGMIENLAVEAYGGTKMKLIEIASLTVEGNDGLLITPFDPGTVADIEKGILTSPLGLSPKTEGNRIVIRIPPLSEEQRIKFTKLVSSMIEDTKNKVRNSRDSIRKKIKAAEDSKELSEDEGYRLEKEIDEMTTKKNEELQSIKIKKEKEIMEV